MFQDKNILLIIPSHRPDCGSLLKGLEIERRVQESLLFSYVLLKRPATKTHLASASFLAQLWVWKYMDTLFSANLKVPDLTWSWAKDCRVQNATAVIWCNRKRTPLLEQKCISKHTRHGLSKLPGPGTFIFASWSWKLFRLDSDYKERHVNMMAHKTEKERVWHWGVFTEIVCWISSLLAHFCV